jgi:hypothetical protein
MTLLKKILLINPWTAAAIGFLILLFSVSGESLDMDEAQTWDYARLATISEFWEELVNDPNSEAQMPLGMLAWWGWGRVAGTSEYAMRALNLVWAAGVMACFALLGKRLSMGWLPLLLAIQPYLWYAMNHARTPVMQIAAGALLLYGTVCFLAEKKASERTLLIILGGAILLCGANMLGLIPVIAVATGLVAHKIWTRIHLTKKARAILFAGIGLLGVLGCYYLATLVRGAGGAKIWNVSPANALYVLYEFFGFQGLGPGRQDLRDVMRGFAPPTTLLLHLPLILALTVGYLLATLAAYKAWLTRPFDRLPGSPSYLAVWAAAAGVLAQSLILLYLLGVAVGFPFWGRHLAGAFPFWVVVLALTMRWAGQGLWRRAGRIGVGLIFGFLALSSAMLYLAPQHDHDDYRSAAREAMQLADESRSVWWVADHSGGEYYGITFLESSTPAPGRISFAPNVASPPEPPPDAIVISRPDNFDRFGAAMELIRGGQYQRRNDFRAFEVWEKPKAGNGRG